ncbi:DUF6170 family protein [Catenovulum maritimum]|uniref:Uncharacterized protein n=1 Tax=Catenovulum maritimum TaxID=1513271 RepID=A0A0J8GV44_9ALTE|nr:DUF6170 family protein [Catenovulum maritimum]KMT66655.1 hypothetical protein XM47_00530 [Catenovulum maritimum]
MRFYFKSSQIPELENYSFKDRSQILAIALTFMTAPDKFILNLLKLLIITPVFILAARAAEWWVLIPMLLAGIFYPIITTPVQLTLSAKYIEKALKKWKKHSEETQN